MAKVLYDKGREGFLAGDIDWDTNDIRLILIDEGQYTFSQAHDNLDDIPAGARIAVSAALASKTVSSGVADAADPAAFSSVTGHVGALALYKHTGTESTSRLILYTDEATGLPIDPVAQEVTVAFNNGTEKIFKL